MKTTPKKPSGARACKHEWITKQEAVKQLKLAKTPVPVVQWYASNHHPRVCARCAVTG